MLMVCFLCLPASPGSGTHRGDTPALCAPHPVHPAGAETYHLLASKTLKCNATHVRMRPKTECSFVLTAPYLQARLLWGRGSYCPHGIRRYSKGRHQNSRAHPWLRPNSLRPQGGLLTSGEQILVREDRDSANKQQFQSPRCRPALHSTAQETCLGPAGVKSFARRTEKCWDR